MDAREPTQEQINNTEKLLEIIEDVPEDKKPEAIRLAQALLLGVTLGANNESG